MAERASEVGQWLPAARSGSPEALGSALEACRAYLTLVADRELEPMLRAKGGASDLVQETFLEAHRDFGQFQGDSEGELLAWLRRLLLNNLANFRRRYAATDKRAADREVAMGAAGSSSNWAEALAGDISSPSRQAMQAERDEGLERALSRLPPNYRQVVEFRYRDALPFEEIAERMARSADAVRKLWCRAIERLQEELEAGP
jgi:RNA polymerase sigma-70 factor (ECF subfamily)